MDTDDLRAFAAFARHLNFTHAARAVHLSQPALFAVVRRLSQEAGVALYARRGRALSLTRAGEQLLAHAQEVVEAERSLLASLRGDADDTVQVLACGEGALTHVVGEAVARFARAHPRRLRVLMLDGESAAGAVQRGEAHVAVVAGQLSNEEGLTGRPLRRSQLVAIGSRALLGASGPLELSALARLPLVLPPQGRPLRRRLDEALGELGLSAQVAVEATGWEALALLARLECGVALVNDVVPVPRGLLARPVTGWPPVVYRTLARRHSPRARELLDALHA